MGKPELHSNRDALARITDSFNRSPVALTLADASKPDLPLVVANAAFADLTGFGPEEVVGRNCRFLQSDLPNADARAEVRAALEMPAPLQVVFRNRHKSGEVFQNMLFLQPLVGRDGTTMYFLGSQFLLDRSVTERRIDLHLQQVDAAVIKAVRTHDALRAEQRRMMANAAHAVASAWLTLR